MRSFGWFFDPTLCFAVLVGAYVIGNRICAVVDWIMSDE